MVWSQEMVRRAGVLARCWARVQAGGFRGADRLHDRFHNKADECRPLHAARRGWPAGARRGRLRVHRRRGPEPTLPRGAGFSEASPHPHLRPRGRRVGGERRGALEDAGQGLLGVPGGVREGAYPR